MEISNLDGKSRVWVYQSNRIFSESELIEIRKEGHKFIDEWAAHGAKLKAAIDVCFNSVLVIAADEDSVKASGCSIDGSVRWVKSLGQALDVDFFDRLKVLVKNGENFEIQTPQSIEELYHDKQINDDTLIFNSLISNVDELTKNAWIPLSKSWVFSRMTVH